MPTTDRLRADTPSDLVLLLLYANDLEGRRRWSGITRLQKLAFLATRDPEYRQLVARREAPELHFAPYKMGPFTSELYNAVETLVTFQVPLIRSTTSELPGQDDVETARYVDEVDLDSLGRPASIGPRPAGLELTDAGRRVAERLWADAPKQYTALLRGLVARFGSMPLRDLLRYVYTQHADMTERSEIKGQLGLV